MKQLRLRLASSLPGVPALASIELDGTMVHSRYSTTESINSPSVITMEVADTGTHVLKVKFLNDLYIGGNDLNLYIGRCQLSNTEGHYVLGLFLLEKENDNYEPGFIKQLYFQDETFVLEFDSANPQLFEDTNAGGDGTMLEGPSLLLSDVLLELPEGQNIYHIMPRQALNTPLTWTIDPAPPAWLAFNEQGHVMSNTPIPAGVDLFFDVTAVDFSGTSSTCKLNIKTAES